jgi:hypothetical protein
MFGLMKVLGSMPVLGRIAASHVPALQTKTQVYPRIARLYAVLANVLVTMGDFDLIQMIAFRHDHSLPFGYKSSAHWSRAKEDMLVPLPTKQ